MTIVPGRPRTLAMVQVAKAGSMGYFRTPVERGRCSWRGRRAARSESCVLSCVVALLSYCFLINAASGQVGPFQEAAAAAEKRAAAKAEGQVPQLAAFGLKEPYVDMDIPDEKHPPLSARLVRKLFTAGGSSREDIKPKWLDSCGYEPVYRLRRPFGTTPAWDYAPPSVEKILSPRPEYTLEQTYVSRMGGIRRMDILSPDEIGRMLSENMILYTDGPGNEEPENSKIAKKYGLRRFHYLRGPSNDPPHETRGVTVTHSPFLKAWEQDYVERQEETLDELLAEWQELPELGSLDRPGWPDVIYMLFAHHDMVPIGYFFGAIDRNYEAVAAAFRKELGFELPIQDVLLTPQQYAHRIKFWLWVKRKYAEMIKLKTRVCRKRLPNAHFAGNVHFGCWHDYERLAESYDWVGSTIRPMMLPENNDLGRLYWVGYATRIFRDLTDKPQMVSVRSNVLGAGARVVPSASALTYWHNQAIQNGCIGFYLWMFEYPNFPDSYSGFCYGNPDTGVLPKIRWNTHMRISKQLGQTRVFTPPKAETGIMVSVATCALDELGGWKRVFSSYIELCRANVWSGFVSDQEIWEESESLDQYKTLYVPTMVFEKEQVAEKLIEFVSNGGTLVCADPRVFSYNLEGEDISHYRSKLFGVKDIHRRATTAKEVELGGDLSGISIHPYTPGYALSPQEGVDILGRYADGQVAVTVNTYGRGKAFLLGAPILDIYSAEIRSFDDIKQREDRGRLAISKRLEQLVGVTDQSWVWDITVQNLKQVTGWVPYEPPVPDESIQFTEEQEEELPDED